MGDDPCMVVRSESIPSSPDCVRHHKHVCQVRLTRYESSRSLPHLEVFYVQGSTVRSRSDQLSGKFLVVRPDTIGKKRVSTWLNVGRVERTAFTLMCVSSTKNS